MISHPAPDRRVVTPDDFRRSYRVGLLRHLARRHESALAAGYELGRRALDEGLNLAEIVSAHHDVLADLADSSTPPTGADLIRVAGEYLVEVLAPHDMAQRSLLAPHRAPDASE